MVSGATTAWTGDTRGAFLLLLKALLKVLPEMADLFRVVCMVSSFWSVTGTANRQMQATTATMGEGGFYANDGL